MNVEQNKSEIENLIDDSEDDTDKHHFKSPKVIEVE